MIRSFVAPTLWALAAVVVQAPAPAVAQTDAELRHASALASYSVGVKAGLGFAQHQGVEERNSEYSVSSDWRRGFAGGVFWVFPITSRFGLQQEVMYARKGSRQDIGVEILEIPTILDVTYEMDYVEVPVLLRLLPLRTDAFDLYSLSGFAFALKVKDRYVLEGEVDDGKQIVPLSADADMSEVDIFDFSFVYGMGLERRLGTRRLLLEYRFTLGLGMLRMPTYAYVPVAGEEILIENDPVPLRNQHHVVVAGIRF